MRSGYVVVLFNDSHFCPLKNLVTLRLKVTYLNKKRLLFIVYPKDKKGKMSCRVS